MEAHRKKFSLAEDPKSFHANTDEHVHIIPTPNAEWFHQPSGKDPFLNYTGTSRELL